MPWQPHDNFFTFAKELGGILRIPKAGSIVSWSGNPTSGRNQAHVTWTHSISTSVGLRAPPAEQYHMTKQISRQDCNGKNANVNNIDDLFCTKQYSPTLFQGQNIVASRERKGSEIWWLTKKEWITIECNEGASFFYPIEINSPFNNILKNLTTY